MYAFACARKLGKLHFYPQRLCNELLLYNILNLYQSWGNWIWRLNQCNAVMWRNTFILVHSIHLHEMGPKFEWDCLHAHTLTWKIWGALPSRNEISEFQRQNLNKHQHPIEITILTFTFFHRINLKWPSRNVFVNKPLWIFYESRSIYRL